MMPDFLIYISIMLNLMVSGAVYNFAVKEPYKPLTSLFFWAFWPISAFIFLFLVYLATKEFEQ